MWFPHKQIQPSIEQLRESYANLSEFGMEYNDWKLLEYQTLQAIRTTNQSEAYFLLFDLYKPLHLGDIVIDRLVIIGDDITMVTLSEEDVLNAVENYGLSFFLLFLSFLVTDGNVDHTIQVLQYFEYAMTPERTSQIKSAMLHVLENMVTEFIDTDEPALDSRAVKALSRSPDSLVHLELIHKLVAARKVEQLHLPFSFVLNFAKNFRQATLRLLLQLSRPEKYQKYLRSCLDIAEVQRSAAVKILFKHLALLILTNRLGFPYYILRRSIPFLANREALETLCEQIFTPKREEFSFITPEV